jgi:hypothetical protein
MEELEKQRARNVEESVAAREKLYAAHAARFEALGDANINSVECKQAYERNYLETGAMGFPWACVLGPLTWEGKRLSGSGWPRDARALGYLNRHTKRHNVYEYLDEWSGTERYYVVTKPESLFQ